MPAGMVGHAPVELGGCKSVQPACADLLAVLRFGVAVPPADQGSGKNYCWQVKNFLTNTLKCAILIAERESDA